MGKFDRKISKKEPDAPTSQKILKKKSNSQLAGLEHNPKGEKERNMKILSFMQRSDDIKSGVGSKVDSHFNAEKMVNKKLRKEEKSRKKDRNN